MKHRKKKVKREHGMVENALPWLENLSRLAEVTDIIPGVINVNRSSGRGIVYKYETATGCKLLLKSNGFIQEVFVVTKNPSGVQEWVTKEFPAGKGKVKSAVTMPHKQRSGLGHEISKLSLKQDVDSATISLVLGNQSPPKVSPKVIKSSAGNLKNPKIKEHLDVSTLQSLGNLKKTLENKHLDDNWFEQAFKSFKYSKD